MNGRCSNCSRYGFWFGLKTSGYHLRVDAFNPSLGRNVKACPKVYNFVRTNDIPLSDLIPKFIEWYPKSKWAGHTTHVLVYDNFNKSRKKPLHHIEI
jgi:hypothetical protein